MIEMKIGITVLKRDEIPDHKPNIVAPGETFRLSIESVKKDINFDILCLPTLDGIAIYGIQEGTCNGEINMIRKVNKMTEIINEKESKCYASCTDCYHIDRENFFRCKKIKGE